MSDGEKFLKASVARQVAELANEWVNKEATKKKLESAINKQFTQDLKSIIAAACGCATDKWGRPTVKELTPLTKMVYEKCEVQLKAKMDAINWESIVTKIVNDLFCRSEIEYQIQREVEEELSKILDKKVEQAKSAALAHLDAAIAALE